MHLHNFNKMHLVENKLSNLPAAWLSVVLVADTLQTIRALLLCLQVSPCLYEGSLWDMQTTSAMTAVDLKDKSLAVIIDMLLCGQHFFVRCQFHFGLKCLGLCDENTLWKQRNREKLTRHWKNIQRGLPRARTLRTHNHLFTRQQCPINNSIQSRQQTIGVKKK